MTTPASDEAPFRDYHRHAWDSETTYGAGAVTTGTDFVVYVSQVEGNVGNDPVTDGGVNWKPSASAGDTGDLLAANNLSDLADAGAARGHLGLGSAATEDSSAFDAAGAAATEASRAEAAEALLAPKADPTLTGTVTVDGQIALAGTTDVVQVAITGAAGQASNLATFLSTLGKGFTIGPTGECIINPGGTDGLIMSNTGIVDLADGDDPQDAVNRRQLDGPSFDIVWDANTHGPVIHDQSDGHTYRLISTNGVVSTVQVT